MILNQTAVYALRAMSVLARHDPGESLRAVELAERANVPPHYLNKVMRRMVVAGLVDARKGHGGGFTLGKSPARITFGAILAAAGVVTEAGECAFGWDRCDAKHPCVLHDAWSPLSEHVEQWARGTTLADLCDASIES